MTKAPTPRETADHAERSPSIAEAVESKVRSGVSFDHAELARLAEAATPGDLDTVPNPPSEYGGYSEGVYDCPACAGQGEVEGATYCNFDGLALGVQFFGIGNAFKNYDAYFRAANPATVLALISEIAALRGEVERVEADRIRTVDDRMTWTRRTLQAERQRDELRKALGNVLHIFPSQKPRATDESEPHAIRTARALIANQGADQ